MHFIEHLGPILGIAAFVGFAVLVFLLFQQARDLRRLREWAGRAPERAQEAADAVQAAAEAARAGAAAPETGEQAAPSRGRLGSAWYRVTDAVGARLSAIDRRLPMDGRYVLAVVAVAVIAAGVLTSGFGLVGGDDHHKHHKHAKPTVAVLNGTSVQDLASRVDKDVVKKAGYKTGKVTNAASSFPSTIVMYLPGHQAQANALAKAVKPKLGEAPVQQMTTDVKARAGGAPLVLGLGLDDAQFGGG
jgi:LytR cell envelope-related transcriptional attenuator